VLNTFYDRLIIAYPRLTLIFVLLVVGLLASQAFKVEIDASSETLLLKDDKDLAYTREINKQYGNPDFLIITYQPRQGKLLGDETLAHIDALSNEIQKLAMIDSVVSILNVPLLQAPDKPIADLVTDITTLGSSDIDREHVKKELLSSPIYSNNLVSHDFSTTALQAYYKEDSRFFELLSKRNELLSKEENNSISTSELQELSEVTKAFKAHRDIMRERNHQTIADIRKIMNRYRDNANLFLGGVNMITDDMTTFIKSDLRIYGSAVLALLIFILIIVFRQLRYVLLPVFITLLSVITTTGLLGLFNWEVTVISSNFISLQLIVTMSLAIHLSVRYRELLRLKPEAEHHDIIREATVSMFIPCLFVIITTVIGFSSLLVSSLLPVINLGWMMSTGIAISFVISFLVFPAALKLTRKQLPYTGFEKHFQLTQTLGYVAEKYGKHIYIVSAIVVLFGVTGASKLIVENSFIDYFKSDTEIYKGMMLIDTKLGGTTPLDVVVDFAEDIKDIEIDTLDEFDDFFDEMSAESEVETSEHQYWFTSEKMERIEAIHNYLNALPETGKVLSFGTVLKVGRIINKGKDLDSLQLALIYNKMPDEFRSALLNPYVDVENNQARFTLRIIDSRDDLRRNQLLGKIQKDLPKEVGIEAQDTHLAGLMLLYNNMLQSLFDTQIKTLALVVLILGAMFFILFRSIKVAFIALTANVIAIGAVFGLMGWAKIPLDMMTITIAAISMGIAVDDSIHYLHRFRLEVAKDGDYLAALHRSHASIGYAIFYTSMAITVGFSVLVLSNFLPTIYFGLLTVMAMLMALIANLLLLPRLILTIKPFNVAPVKEIQE
jgi:predicted RND superfamily exporter protein